MTGGRASRRKGDGIERELVNLHRELGIRAARYPLSGASRFRGSGHDIDLYVRGRETAPLVAEVKAAATGQASHSSRNGSATTTHSFCVVIAQRRLCSCPGAFGPSSFGI